MSEAPLAPGLRFRLEAARALGCRVECLDPDTGYLFAIERDGRRQLLLGGLSPLNDAVAMTIASDKFHCATVLRAAGFRVPRQARCLRPGRFEPDTFATHDGTRALDAFVASNGFPLIVKPGHGARGRDVEAIDSRDALEAAITRIWHHDHLALVETVADGIDLRIDVLDDACLIAYTRSPAPGHPAGDPVLNLNRHANACVVDPLPEAWRLFSVRIGQTLSLRHFGVDLKVRDLAHDPFDADPEKATIIEVNGSPSMEQISLLGHEPTVIEGEKAIVEAFLAKPRT